MCGHSGAGKTEFVAAIRNGITDPNYDGRGGTFQPTYNNVLENREVPPTAAGNELDMYIVRRKGNKNLGWIRFVDRAGQDLHAVVDVVPEHIKSIKDNDIVCCVVNPFLLDAEILKTGLLILVHQFNHDYNERANEHEEDVHNFSWRSALYEAMKLLVVKSDRLDNIIENNEQVRQILNNEIEINFEEWQMPLLFNEEQNFLRLENDENVLELAKQILQSMETTVISSVRQFIREALKKNPVIIIVPSRLDLVREMSIFAPQLQEQVTEKVRKVIHDWVPEESRHHLDYFWDFHHWNFSYEYSMQNEVTPSHKMPQENDKKKTAERFFEILEKQEERQELLRLRKQSKIGQYVVIGVGVIVILLLLCVSSCTNGQYNSLLERYEKRQINEIINGVTFKIEEYMKDKFEMKPKPSVTEVPKTSTTPSAK
jgi:hypothetical protein